MLHCIHPLGEELGVLSAVGCVAGWQLLGCQILATQKERVHILLLPVNEVSLPPALDVCCVHDYTKLP